MKKVKIPFKEKTTSQKILGILLDTLLVIVILSLLFVGYGVGVNNRFYKLLVVTSGSMTPTFAPGDLIFITKMDPKDAKVGNIVTFQTKDGQLLTHRIVEIKSDGEIVTKGDANNSIDTWSNGWKLGRVEMKYIFTIPKLGYPISWLQSTFKHLTTGAYYNDQKTITDNNLQTKN